MADKKISELNSTSLPLSGTEVIPIVQGGETKKVSVSEFKDVIEGYFNGTNFYTDSGFTNLITPESSKIYLNIAVTPATQYIWSGSAYVQLSAGIDFPSDGKTYGAKDGVAVRAMEYDFFNPYTSDYFIGTTRPAGTSFILSGFNSNWANVGTLEAFSDVSEYTLVGVKSATTAGSSCQFLGNYVVRTYPVPRLNKLIQWQIFRNSDALFVANARFFVGIINKFGLIGNTNPSTNFNLIGVGADSGDTNIQVIHNDQSGVATKIDLGVNFPANTQNADTYLVQKFFDIPNAKAYIRLVRLNTGHEVITEITTNLPAMSGGLDLAPVFWRNNGTDALEVKMRIGSFLQAQKMM